jgi:hypothetical protein
LKIFRLIEVALKWPLILIFLIIPFSVKAENSQNGYLESGGLIWTPISVLKNWHGANNFCLSLQKDNLNDWRLPTKTELTTLYASNEMQNKGWVLTNTWSSSNNGLILSHHWVYSLDEGKDYPLIDYYLNYVTCVHARTVAP